ncbi:PepSY domain-containing protein [Hyphomonas sp.]|uniref:PepSY domain-containing protein n=1 Tax=Hyphomonas sp. TaxID=87 RepID=UPI0025BACC85|nr:PepSY domain-containing protein [Hyphomonas sp.]
MTELLRSTLLAALLMLAGAGPALAGKDGNRAAAEFEINEAQALEIARAQGIAAVREVKARRGVWKFEGVDADGVDLEVEIDGFTGEVVKVERYGMPAQGF